MSKHAPTPWKVETDPVFGVTGIWDADDRQVVETDSGDYPPEIDTAEFMVRAANAHDELVEALRSCLKSFEGAHAHELHRACACDHARAALEKAGVTP